MQPLLHRCNNSWQTTAEQVFEDGEVIQAATGSRTSSRFAEEAFQERSSLSRSSRWYLHHPEQIAVSPLARESVITSRSFHRVALIDLYVVLAAFCLFECRCMVHQSVRSLQNCGTV